MRDSVTLDDKCVIKLPGVSTERSDDLGTVCHRLAQTLELACSLAADGHIDAVEIGETWRGGNLLLNVSGPGLLIARRCFAYQGMHTNWMREDDMDPCEDPAFADYLEVEV